LNKKPKKKEGAHKHNVAAARASLGFGAHAWKWSKVRVPRRLLRALTQRARARVVWLIVVSVFVRSPRSAAPKLT